MGTGIPWNANSSNGKGIESLWIFFHLPFPALLFPCLTVEAGQASFLSLCPSVGETRSLLLSVLQRCVQRCISNLLQRGALMTCEERRPNRKGGKWKGKETGWRKGSICHELAHQRGKQSCLFPEQLRQQILFLAKPLAAVSSTASQQCPQLAVPQCF